MINVIMEIMEIINDYEDGDITGKNLYRDFQYIQIFTSIYFIDGGNRAKFRFLLINMFMFSCFH